VNKRYANLTNNPLYIQSILKAESIEDLPCTAEILSKRDRYNEMLMTGFRTAAGVDLAETEKKWGLRPDLIDPKAWEQALEHGVLLETGPRVRVAEESWLIGDSVAAQFFAVED
jgi:oxygen-independent coproporphyrinogen-3 oxidase